MAIVVNFVVEPLAEGDDAEAVQTLADYVRDVESSYRILAGSVVGLDRTVDLTPPTPAPTEP